VEKFRKLEMHELIRLNPDEIQRSDRFPLVLILDSIRSLSNVGSIFRTADSLGLQSVVLCGLTGQPPHREIQKTALGATESVPWSYYQSIGDAIVRLKSEGYQIIALEQAIPNIQLQKFNPEKDQSLALILGNEVSGVSDEALEFCDSVLEIPQFGAKHSLNVAVSAGIASWQIISNWIK
jgi:23S rRNA (guanosine2251-2'-O)-methyltransferase